MSGTGDLPPPWPLSAAATIALWSEKVTTSDTVRLGVRELVLRRSWRLERVRVPRRLGRDVVQTSLVPGGEPVADLAPLREIDALVRELSDEGIREAGTVVRRLLRSSASRGVRAADDAVARDLARRGLVELRVTRVLGSPVRTTMGLTDAGRAMVSESLAREEALERALRAGASPGEVATSLGALVLLLSPGTLADLNRELRRARELDGESDGRTGREVTPADIVRIDDRIEAFDELLGGLGGGGGDGGGGGGGDAGGGGGGS